MKFKFILFPSGVGLYPLAAPHDSCRVVDANGEEESPFAAGFAVLGRGDVFLLEGRSANLELGSDGVYHDWLERHVKSGLAPQKKTYTKGGGDCLFLPFKPVLRFGVNGIGRSDPPCGAPAEDITMEEVIKCFKK